jgi:hypothetical protein
MASEGSKNAAARGSIVMAGKNVNSRFEELKSKRFGRPASPHFQPSQAQLLM